MDALGMRDDEHVGDLTSEVLCEHYYECVHRHLVIRTRSETLADDLTQDTMLIAIRHLDDCREKAKVCGWLMVIANNVFNRHVEKECRLRRYIRMRVEEGPHIPRQSDESRMLAGAVEDMLLELAAMPPPLRDAVTTTYLQGLDYEESARHLGISIATLRMRLFRAKKRLARALRKHCRITW